MSSTTTEASNVKGADRAAVGGEATKNHHTLNVRVTNHPLLSHKISILRSSSTRPSQFRAVLREITFHLGYEATASLTTRSIPLTVPTAAAAAASTDTTDYEGSFIETTGVAINDRVALIPILRSGLGMVESMLELLPFAGVHHIGMYRAKGSEVPIQYYNRLPRKCSSDIAYVMDPVIGTASTVLSVVGILKKWGVPKIHVISVVASRKGIDDLAKTHPDVMVTIGTIDPDLTADGVVIPGLGDSGDRLFGTPQVVDAEADEELLHPSKRRRQSSVDLMNNSIHSTS